MRESQQSITKWAHDTFGITHPLSVAARMHCEVAELLAGAVAFSRAAPLIEELADIGVMVLQVAEMSHLELPDLNSLCTLTKDNFIREVTEDWGCDNVGFSRALDYTSFNLMSAIIYPLSGNQVFHQVVRVIRLAGYFCALLGGNLPEEIDNKMTINRARSWAKKPNGQFQHVEEAHE